MDLLFNGQTAPRRQFRRESLRICEIPSGAAERCHAPAWHLPRTCRGYAASTRHQEDLFHSEGDRELYLAIINRFARRCGVEIAGFCVMTSHVHFVMVPTSLRGISDCLGRAHRKYSEYLNIRRGRFGSNWEGRFYSEPMSEAHAVHALRYIERNPVAAGIVRSATEWRWSSAGLHCGKGCLWELVTADVRPFEFRSPDIWSSFLEKDLDHNERSMVGWINRTEVMNAALDGPFR